MRAVSLCALTQFSVQPRLSRCSCFFLTLALEFFYHIAIYNISCSLLFFSIVCPPPLARFHVPSYVDDVWYSFPPFLFLPPLRLPIHFLQYVSFIYVTVIVPEPTTSALL